MKLKSTAILDKWFTNKEEYLIWRAEWRAHLKLLIAAIHEQKRLRRSAPSAAERGMACYERQRLRAVCAGLMQIRKDSKLAAQQQYLAAHAQSAVAA